MKYTEQLDALYKSCLKEAERLLSNKEQVELSTPITIFYDRQSYDISIMKRWQGGIAVAEKDYNDIIPLENLDISDLAVIVDKFEEYGK